MIEPKCLKPVKRVWNILLVVHCEPGERHTYATALEFHHLFFSVLPRKTCSTINLQTDTTALLVPVFQYPETLEDQAEEPRVSRGGAGVPLDVRA